MRYTHYWGEAKLRFEIGMTYARMSLKEMVFSDYMSKAVQASA